MVNVYSALKLIFEEERYVIEQKIILNKNSRRIDFETTIDWHETNKMLRVEFPVNVRSSQASFEIQYGHVFRNTHENTSWDMAQFEVVAHKWADISQPNYGVGIINDCKYGHKIKGNVISLNLLRSPKTPDPDSDMHEHQFTYALYPHAGTMVQSDLIRQAYQLNIPLEGIKADLRSSASREWYKRGLVICASEHRECRDRGDQKSGKTCWHPDPGLRNQRL
jgi:alpha-mannosidase